MPSAQRAALGDFLEKKEKCGFAAFLQNAPPVQKNALPLFYMKRIQQKNSVWVVGDVPQETQLNTNNGK